jgi:hypothetical protein
MPMLPVPDPAALIGRGLAVFPLRPAGRRAAPGWQDRCTSDPELVYRRWRPGDNIGAGCRASNVVGLDLDRAGGAATFAAVCAAHGQPWPDTLTVRTPHGGLHLYFRAPAGRVIASSSGGRAGLGPGVDVRGPGRRSGGYLVGPGFVVDGTPYVITRDTAIQALPRWLADLLDDQAPAAVATAPCDANSSCQCR